MARRMLAVFLLLSLLSGLSAVVFAAEKTDAEPYDALPEAEAIALLNRVQLHPQRTGYVLLDALLEEIVAPTEGEDTYTRLKAAYDWCVYEIAYSWAPYSQDWAPAYDCFDLCYDLEYEEGLQEAIPYEVANRAYHALSARQGICYDYGAAFAVIARYLGAEAFVHTGYFRFEEQFGSTSGHHGWAVLKIDGAFYVFDPQRDYRLSADATQENPYAYFCIAPQDTWRYRHDGEDNAARDAQYLPVTQTRTYQPVLRAEATRFGRAFGSAPCAIGEEVTLHAYGCGFFLGWYDRYGTLLSTQKDYTFVFRRSIVCYAVFDASFFSEVAGVPLPDTGRPEELPDVNGLSAQAQLREFFFRP